MRARFAVLLWVGVDCTEHDGVCSAGANASCGDVDAVVRSTSAYGVGWGIDLHNTRYQPESSINADTASRLALKWTYGLASTAPHSYPLITEDTIFIGDGGRGLVALVRETGSHWLFISEYGPSGAAVWGAPSHDAELDWLFFGTGQNYSHPTNDTSDAIFAVEAATGKVVWIRQYPENDAYTAACNIEALNHPNCPDPRGPDVDFGAPTMLVQTESGRKIVIAGQKFADVHALDRQTGKRIWTEKLGRGRIIGGVHWGLAANENLGMVFVPISDKKVMGFASPGEAAPGLYALDITTGRPLWSYSRASRCASQECVFGYSAAVTATNDVVVAGSMDGYLEIFSAITGERLWSHDAFREYLSVNGVASHGGAFDAHGAMVADDLLIVSSGYAYVGEQRAGNALLVFQLEPEHE